jgi:alkanesulfonate monooxygenase SsuD/methylene tetrahydromethanopterin reductase-like flavin-dependent oxidoreductase (luciferase family)
LWLVYDPPHEMTWQQWRELADACELAGIDGLAFSDHYVARSGELSAPGRFDSWIVIAGLAAVTAHLRFATLVSPVTFRHPAVLSRMAVTADHISAGRIEVGLGTAWNEAEHDVLGVPFPGVAARFDMLESHLAAVSRFWHDADPHPLQEPRLPLIVGGLGLRRSVGLAVRYADEYNRFLVSPSEIAAFRACLDAAGGEHLRISLGAKLVMSAEAAVVEAARRAADLPGGRYRLPDRSLLIGPPEAVQVRLTEFAAAGVERVYLRPAAMPILEAVNAIGSNLIPASRSEAR